MGGRAGLGTLLAGQETPMRLAGRSTFLCAALLLPQLLGAQMIHGTIANAVTGYAVASVAVSLVD